MTLRTGPQGSQTLIPFSKRWQAFSESLSHALDLPEPDKAPWLGALAARDPELAEALVNALAARARADFSNFLSEPLLAPAGPPFVAGLVGRHAGPYVIEAEIGRGGMGSVWRARRADDRYEGIVAIKFLHMSWRGLQGEQRFRSEGRILGRLDHQNIARLIDAGVLDASQPYLVLEYVEGEPIDTYCSLHNLTVEARVRLFLSVLAAVAHAHSHLIVHRDIKPSNILVTQDGSVKLLDFGIAKLLDDESASSATRSGAALTPQYAAPEQLLGNVVTTETDVYALGLVLYLLLTGGSPFATASGSQAEILQAVLTQDPPRASTAVTGPNTRARELRGDLDNIVAKALKKVPADRYRSVGAFVEDLRRYLAHEPVQARPDTAAYVVAKFVRRHRGSVLIGLLVAFGLIATSSFAVFQMYEARAERDVAVAAAKLANAEADLTQFLGGDSLSKVPQEEVHERLDRARVFVTRRFRDDLPLAARLLIDVSSQYLDIGDEKTAAGVIVQAESIGRHFDDHEVLGLIACLRAQDLAIANDLAGARAQLDDGRAKMRLLHRVPTGLRAECATAAGFVLQSDGNFAQAATELRGAVDYLDQSGMHGSAQYTSLANDLADALLLAGNFRGAWDVEREEIAIMDANGRANTPAYFAYASAACMSLRSGGQPRRSLEFAESIRDAAYHSGPAVKLPYYFTACQALSAIAMGGRSSDNAETTLLHAAEQAEEAGMMTVVVGYRAAAVMAAIDRGDLAGADARWQPLVPTEERMLAAHERGVDIVRLLGVHARLDMSRGHLDDALGRIQKAASLVASRNQPINRDGGEIALLNAQLQLARHANAQALHQAQVAVDLTRAQAVDPRSSAWIGEALVWRARAEAALGQKISVATALEALPHLLKNLDTGHPIIALARRLAAGDLRDVDPPLNSQSD
jgi:eukaryotic-like serine/threonine-protein kinase